MIDLRGKHIFVGGGSRGIGRATALLAAKAGADVSVSYLTRADSANEVAEEIWGMGQKAAIVTGDLATRDGAQRAVAEAAKTLGPPFGVVISAGIFEPMPLEEMSVEFWERTMSINLRSTMLTVQAVAAWMRRAKKGGSIVIFSSTAGQRGSSIYSAYATSKAAQLIFMRSMAKELAPDRIRVNCVSPGWTETDMSRDAMTAAGRDDIIKSVPLGRIGKPEDPAGAACFLLSDLAQFITGSTITVDGGMDMRG